MTRPTWTCACALALLALLGVSPAAAQHRGRPRGAAASAQATATASTPEALTPEASPSTLPPEPDAPGSPDGPLLLPVVLKGGDEVGVEFRAGATSAETSGLRETPTLRRLRRAFLFRDVHQSVLDLEQRESVPPASITSQEIALWTATSQQAVHQLAMGDYDGARESLLAAQSISERTVEELNRETDRARQVLDTCLFVVRAYVETHDFSRAEQQARECRRLVPFVEPTAMIHPPEVRRALNDADALIDQAGHGSLVVRSEPTGCTVRLNGVEVGQSPYRLDDLPEGEYRAQVECDARQRGRVHNVAVRRGSHVLRVDTRFDAALRTRPFPALVYPDVAAREAHLLADAFRVARATGASEVVLAIVDGPRLRLERVVMPAAGNLPPTRSSAQRELSAGASEAELRPALTNLLGATPAADAFAANRPTDPERLASRPTDLPRWRWVTGLVATGIGTAAFVFAIQQRMARSNRGDQLLAPEFTDPDYLLRVGRWRGHQTPLRTASVIGGLLSMGAAALLTPTRRASLGLSLPLLGAGGALVVSGLVRFATRPSCQGLADDRAHCIDHEEDADLGWLLGSLGAPLLTAGVLGLVYPEHHAGVLALSLTPTRGGLRLGFSLRL